MTAVLIVSATSVPDSAQHDDRVLALALVLDVGDLADHRQLARGRKRGMQPDGLRSV
jgi:hypothetical protein